MVSRHGRKFLKLNNYIILFAIYDIITSKRLDIEIHKVKGHSVDNLRKRNDIYDDVPCPACRDHEETLNHLVICAGLEQAFLTAEKETIDKIRKYLKRFKCKKSVTINELYISIFEYRDPAFPELKQRNRQELLRGLISHTIVKKLRKLTSKRIASRLSLKIIKYFHEAFREHVWKPRCKIMNELEESLHITPQDKCKTSRTHKEDVETQRMISLSLFLRCDPYRYTLTAFREQKTSKYNEGLRRCKDHLYRLLLRTSASFKQAYKVLKNAMCYSTPKNVGKRTLC
ncbi:hypothetical protein GLOIN_2v1474501 [Rhizophagus irregularis DAOM 181602=DAOM 197198]|uniref:RNase H type-1 domain-containing protein n=1 Tax=Rhizophagus irregularis (strain DAOM 181602 / DAOM 197198 / MUCL 43194) TaxID=747089 RepID=A0A2P4QGB3_RHIID|nr:hypothetical protein GLOIN_2v1474501 [Rhizophagus irregularis DAOM 181602=DAOM 197198]POG76668.1 hypothetical protein GLOIN_2v1474501 [Rhizophagus irregularis DAOM 181602=DAOM 197198]|eukprot:XP_025183534.1 hypothetical protein GLOIN_2v1474501 [Rhizophagus irregularis DAOM 181602=DAOM 197198]